MSVSALCLAIVNGQAACGTLRSCSLCVKAPGCGVHSLILMLYTKGVVRSEQPYVTNAIRLRTNRLFFILLFLENTNGCFCAGWCTFLGQCLRNDFKGVCDDRRCKHSSCYCFDWITDEGRLGNRGVGEGVVWSPLIITHGLLLLAGGVIHKTHATPIVDIAACQVFYTRLQITSCTHTRNTKERENLSNQSHPWTETRHAECVPRCVT